MYPIISVAELIAPILGGELYERAGTLGMFSAGAVALSVDFVMRLLVLDNPAAPATPSSSVKSRSGSALEAGETDPLLRANGRIVHEEFKILKDPRARLDEAFPFLHCFLDPRIFVGLFLSFVHASMVGTFNATLPTEAQSLFHFSSRQVGLLFIPLIIPYLACGLPAGMAVDRRGPRIMAVAGYIFQAPCLLLLGISSRDAIQGQARLALFCVALALNGVGMAVISLPGFVEATNVTQKYAEANPGFFGKNGPYAQLYGMDSLFIFSGLAVGPLVGGMLRDSSGYGVMMACFAAFSGFAAVLSFLVLGERT